MKAENIRHIPFVGKKCLDCKQNNLTAVHLLLLKMSTNSSDSDRSWPPRDRENPEEWSQSSESDSRESVYADTASEASARSEQSDRHLDDFLNEMIDDAVEEDDEAHRQSERHLRDFISDMVDEAIEEGDHDYVHQQQQHEQHHQVRLGQAAPRLHQLELDSRGESKNSSVDNCSVNKVMDSNAAFENDEA